MSNIRVREFGGVKAVAGEPSPSDLAILAGVDFAGGEVKAEEVRVREMLLCHDQYDRTFERFPKAYLERFCQTLPGKSVLSGHDSGGFSGAGALPLARFFRARVARRDEAEFPVLVRESKSADAGGETKGVGERGAEIVPGFEAKAARVHWCQPGFYYPNDAESAGLDRRIRLGVYRSVSIGFRYDDVLCDLCNASYWNSDCPHIRGRWVETGKGARRLVTLTYSGDVEQVEALEGSIVYLGAQPEARLLKSIQERIPIDVDALAWTPYGTDPVLLKEAEAAARKYGHAQKAWRFPALAGKTEKDVDLKEQLRKLFGLPETASDDEIFAAAEQAKQAAAGTGKAADTTELEQKATAAEQRATAAEAKVKELEPKAKVADQALADLQKSILEDDFTLTGKAENAELQEIVQLHVKNGNYERLSALAKQKRDAVLEKFPAGISGDPEAGRKKEDREKTDDAGRKPRPAEYSLV